MVDNNGSTRFAGGETPTKNLASKISCDNDLVFFNKRLQYERKGTTTECLRRGYGHGLNHTTFRTRTPYRTDDTVQDPEEANLVDEQRVVFSEWDEPLGYWPQNDREAFDVPPDARDDPRINMINIDIRDFAITNETGNVTNDVIVALEALQPDILTANRQANFPTFCFFGFFDAATNRKREYRFLHHDFDMERVRSILSPTDIQKMCRARLNPEGVILFALPLLGPHMHQIHTYESADATLEPFVLCEVDFSSSTIVFYYTQDNTIDLSTYKEIMTQQFVVPRDTNWRVRQMTLDTPTTLVWAAVRRMLGRGIQSAFLNENQPMFPQPFANSPEQIGPQAREVVRYLQLLDALPPVSAPAV